MLLTNQRANTKATPDAVFAACKALEARDPDNPSFRNEEVLAITGGGMAVVSRLVKIYRDNKAVVDSCSELDAATAISLVESLNALLAAHTTRTKAALSHAEATMEQAIGELGEINESLNQELAATQERVKLDQEAHQLLRQDYEKTLKALDLRHQELEFANDQIRQLTGKLESQTVAHEEKTSQLSQRHAEMLASALEAQRKTLEKEKAEALSRTNQISNEVITQFEIKLESALQEKNRAEHTIVELQRSQQEVAAERSIERRGFEEIRSGLESTLAEKNSQLTEAKALYHQLISVFKREQETNTHQVADNLSTVSKSAESLNSQLEKLSESLHQILDGK